MAWSTLGRRQWSALYFVLAAWASLPAGSPAFAEGPQVAQWVRADAAIYLEVSRPTNVLDRVTDPRFQTVLQAVPGYQKAIEYDGYRKLREVVGFVTGALGTTWDQGLRDLTGGGIILAVEGQPGQQPRVILIVSPQDADFLGRAHAKLLELARKDAADKSQPDPIQQVDYRGVTSYSVGGEEAHAIVANQLVITNGKETLHAVIDRSLDGDKAGSAITSDTTWKARRAQVPADASAWGLVRIDRLKALDPKKFQVPHQPNPGATFLFGHWLEALRQAPWLAASVTWTADRMRAEIALPTPASGYSDEWKKFLPPAESGGAAVAPHPPGTIACLSLWRDLAAIWEVRADLFSPETVQNLTKLDSFAGQFFAGRDFGTGVLGSLAGDWRLVIAHQDYAAMNPVPDVKLPAFALVINLKPGDDEFAQRLKVAFQTFIGLANVGGAQSKAPPLMLGSEEYEGVSIATARFMPPKDALPKDASVHQRHNFSPSAMQVGDHFVLSSSTGLARSLAKTLKEPRKPTDVTLLAEVDPTELAKLVEVNKSRLVMQNMLQKGNDKAAAEKEIGLLTSLLQYVGLATLSAKDGAEAVQLHLNVSIPAR